MTLSEMLIRAAEAAGPDPALVRERIEGDLAYAKAVHRCAPYLASLTSDTDRARFLRLLRRFWPNDPKFVPAVIAASRGGSCE
jgi:hypothetical protein